MVQRSCAFSTEGSNYNTETEFVSYAVQRRDGSRFLVLQYQRENSEQHFAIIELRALSSGRNPGIFGEGQEQEYQPSFDISSRADAERLVTEEGTNFHMTKVSINYLDRVLRIFQTTSVIRSTGVARAMEILSERVRGVIGIQINPIELVLSVADIVADKKARGFCAIV